MLRGMQPVRKKPYPSDPSDVVGVFGAPYRCLLPDDALLRRYDLREPSDALAWIMRAGDAGAPNDRAQVKRRFPSARARAGYSLMRSGKVMRDHHVRPALHRTVLRRHHADPATLVLDELGLRRGAARVDVAVVNGHLAGYEIKAAADTLRRLPAQASCLNAVLDRVTLVVADRHLRAAVDAVPGWWGVLLAETGACGGVHFHTVRRARRNPAVDPAATAELLWRDELVAALAEAGETGRTLRQPRAVLCRRVADLLGEAGTRALVTRRLKGRRGWRDRERPAQGGDSRPPTPTC